MGEAVTERTDVRGGPDAADPAAEETVRLARREFARRRRSRRLLSARPLIKVLVVLVAVAALVWVVAFSSVLAAEKVEVSGNEAVSAAAVEHAAQVPVGTPLARVDLAAIRARVENLAAVRSVQISRAWPHTIGIQVTERVAVAVVKRGNGFRGLDDQGVLFRRYRSKPAGLPVVEATKGADTEALREAARVVGALPSSVSRRVDHVSVATVDRITLVLHSGRSVFWGSAEDSRNKADVLAVLIKRPGKRLDVSVPANPTTRP